MSLKACGRLARWWHEKMRRYDCWFVGATLLRQEGAGIIEPGMAIKAWTLHKRMTSSRHWRCECCPWSQALAAPTAREGEP